MTRPALFLAALLCVGPAWAAETYALPNSKLTPGVVNRFVSLEAICSIESDPPGVSSTAVKEWVLGEYGIPLDDEANYKIDRLIPLRLGGSSTLANFWPQTLSQAKTKDRLEVELQRRVCHGRLPLDVAQVRIVANWVSAYQDYVGRLPSEDH